MKPKTLFKIMIDIAMIILMLVAMASRLTGNTMHELVGITLFGLFILHNLLNLQWYKALFKGQYDTVRIVHTAVNLLLLAAMLLLMSSAILISHKIFAFMGFNVSLIVRQIHMVTTYWAFVLMSVHLGIHWSGLMSIARNCMPRASISFKHKYLLRIIASLIGGYGVYASFSRELGLKLIMYYTYDFWNYDQLQVFFFLDYLSIMGLFVYVTYYVLKFFRRLRKS